MSAAAIILAGGRSSRMGTAKAALDWHGSTLLRRVSGIAQRAVDGPVIVVRAPGQDLPVLSPAVQVTQDAHEGRGPLQGLAAGLEAIGDRAEAAFVSATDVPLLHPAFISSVLAALEPDVDVVLPEVDGYRQPLSAAYRVALLPGLQALLDAGRRKPAFLFEAVRVRRLTSAALLADSGLAAADPGLGSVRNLNEPADYARAHALPAPQVEVRLATAAPVAQPPRQVVGAWTLGELAAIVGVAPDARVAAALNGDPVSGDPELPLVAGDRVLFTLHA